LFCRILRSKKDDAFSFYLLLHGIEYEVARRFFGRIQENVLFVGDLDVSSILLKAGGQSFYYSAPD
jgi:hypothetical protein